jgi:hypothetical protein
MKERFFMEILALDLATKTGWALVSDGKVMASGVQDFSLKRGESPGMIFLRHVAWLTQMLALRKFTLIGYEAPHHRGGAATRLLEGLATHTESFCAENDIQYGSVHSGTLKKHATGGGKGTKKEVMLEAAEERWPHVKWIDDNHVDAVWVADYMFNTYDPKAVSASLIFL